MLRSLQNLFVSKTIDEQQHKSPGTSDYLVELSQVVKSYETPAGPFVALKGVDLHISPGEFAAVIGKSGSGKSTLINMITGIDRPTLGEVHVAGTPLHHLGEGEIARWRGRNLGVVFQFFQLLPTLTLVENIMLPMEFCRLYTAQERYDRAMALLEMVGIVDHAHKFPAALSGGQQQRTAIARSLANDPAILVADEPTGNLDAKTADAIFQIFTDFVSQGKTILMVTHDRDLASRVNRVVLIADGEIVDQRVSQALPTLGQKQLVELSSRLEPISYPAGATIFKQGDPADKFYIIVKGEVEVVLAHNTQTEVITARLAQGQYFGEAGLLENQPRNATVRASQDSDVILMAIEQPTFEKIMTTSQLTYEAIATLMHQRTTTNHLQQIISAVPNQPNQSQSLNGNIRTFAPGEVIIRRGDPADMFYLINKGTVEVMAVTDESEPITTLVSGQYFGEIGLLTEGRRTKTVRAAPDCDVNIELIGIDQTVFRQLMVEQKMVQHEIALLMQQRLSDNIQETTPGDLPANDA
ncbi:MAG: cyclic nucleotide-binding domain-containing protein [Chloroflexota bacterium]